tara:strand:+ start:1672 stop:1818 length:147 start_codon:yes stop_codon:yes gene_type:complete
MLDKVKLYESEQQVIDEYCEKQGVEEWNIRPATMALLLDEAYERLIEG